MNATWKQVTKARYIEQIAALAAQIWPPCCQKLGPKTAAALPARYQSEEATDDAIHSGAVNYFLVCLGSEAVGYFALDLSTPGALCLRRLLLREDVRGRGIGRSIVAYAQKLAEGDGRTRLYLRVWAKDLRAEGFCKRCRFHNSGTVPVEVLPGVTLDIATWEKFWR